MSIMESGQILSLMNQGLQMNMAQRMEPFPLEKNLMVIVEMDCMPIQMESLNPRALFVQYNKCTTNLPDMYIILENDSSWMFQALMN